MSDLILTATASRAAAKPAKRPSRLAQLILALLHQHGQMPRSELVKAALDCLREHGKPAHKANLYTRLRAIQAAGWVEVRRMDGTSWVISADPSARRGRRHVIQGQAVVRGGKATFKAKATGCPAYKGAATLSFIK